MRRDRDELCSVILELVGVLELHSFFFIRICFISISRPKFVKIVRIFKNIHFKIKPEAEILKRI